MARSNFIVRGGADFSSIRREMDSTQKRMKNFKSGLSKTMRTIGTILGTIATGALIKNSTQAAMTVESSVNNINRNMENSAKAFQGWVETQSKPFAIAKEDAYKYGSTFSNLLGSFTTSSKETAAQTTELMKAAAIISSKTGRTYDDTANRIRSGMLGSTEAIEDLGVYTQVSMLESTEAFRKFAGDKSWAQLDFQTQQQIRLAAILEQTYARYGDTLADTTQTRQAMFIASLKNAKLSLGQAFLPIYNVVLPLLTKFADKLGYVANLIAQFSTALFGAPKTSPIEEQISNMEDLSSATTDAGNAAVKAAKKANALAGFDQINKLKSTSTSGNSGGSQTTTSSISLDDGSGGLASSVVEVSDKVKKMAEDFKKSFGKVAKFVKKYKTKILKFLAGLGAGILTYLGGTSWGKVVKYVKLAKKVIIKAFKTINVPLLAVSALVAAFIAAVVELWQENKAFRDNVIKAWNGIKDTLKKVWNTVLKPIFVALGDMFAEIYNEGIKPLWDKWKEFVNQVVMLMADLWNALKPIVDWIIKTFGPVIVEIFKWLFTKIKENILGVINIVSSVITAFTTIASKIRDIFNGVVSFVKKIFNTDWAQVWEGVKDGFRKVGDWFGDKVEYIKDLFKGIPDFIKDKIANAWSRITNLFKSGGNLFSGIKEGLAKTFKSIVNNLIDGINKIIKTPFNSINKLLNKIRATKVFGRKPFLNLWSYNPLSVPSIPKLAQGGYFGANSDTLAIVGDNKTEGEIIAPESKIYEQTYKAISDAMSGDKPIDLTINLGGTTIFKEIINGINMVQRQAGKTLINI